MQLSLKTAFSPPHSACTGSQHRDTIIQSTGKKGGPAGGFQPYRFLDPKLWFLLSISGLPLCMQYSVCGTTSLPSPHPLQLEKQAALTDAWQKQQVHEILWSAGKAY